jgi:hypothetical protein
MSQEYARKTTVSLFGAKKKTGQENFLGNINRWHFLLVQDKAGRTVVTIPLWIAIAALIFLAGFLRMRKRKRE